MSEPAATQPAGGEIRLVSLCKRFGDVTAVDGIHLDIPRGAFFSLLGPSGCGKTTTLRMIAGFEHPTSGQVLLDGKDMVHTPAHRRHINTVFQSYALFPHLNVFNNVAYGLRRKRVAKSQLRERVGQALELVRLNGYERRHPRELSGGQQQRVALARALVLQPSVLLLDEPLGALDARLRKQLQIELKSVQEQVGITFVYVTHDQEEALTMSDWIAVMSEGQVEQVGDPKSVYEQPATPFVAEFLGVSNLMDAAAFGANGDGYCRIKLGEFALKVGRGATTVSGDVRVVIRPERVQLEPRGGVEAPENRIPGQIARTVYLGNATQFVVELASGQHVQALTQNVGDDLPFAPGDHVNVHLPVDALRVLTGAADRA